jgi:hypothetical protein
VKQAPNILSAPGGGVRPELDRGNDLTTPSPETGFPGLKPGDRWCLCAGRWKEALATERGSQVSYAHPEGYAIMQALIARGVIGDFRAPDVLRFGFAVLYLRYVDLYDAVMRLAEVMRQRTWDRAEFKSRKTVT